MTNADIITGVSMMLLFVFAGQALADFSGWLNSTAWAESANLWFDFGFDMGFLTLLIAHITFDIPYVIVAVLPRSGSWTPTWRRPPRPGRHPVDRLSEGGAAGADARHRQRHADRLHHEHRRLRHQLLHRRQPGVHPVHVRVRPGPPPGEPEINALSTLMFVAVLLLLVVINLRQARQEQRRKRQALRA